MSLAIDVDRVTKVLLADGWHEVANTSFTLDAYEYLWYSTADPQNFEIMHGGGSNGVCATGFSFKTPDGDHMCGPLTAILAVRVAPRNDTD